MRIGPPRCDTLAAVRAVDEWAREHAREIAARVRIEGLRFLTALTTLLAFAFVLGVLVFVHELGHFLAAKRVGIRVLKFQLGFNPTIVSFRRGDTEYGIGALPLGGYVKMAGENPEDARATGRVPDEFLSKTKWQRFQVLIMGPVMNLLLAFVLTAVVLYQGAEKAAYEDQPPVVGVGHAGFGGGEGRHPAGRPHRRRRRPRRRHVGRVPHRGRHAAEPRVDDRARCATGSS